MTTFTARLTKISEYITFTPGDDPVQYDPDYDDPPLMVTRITVVYTLYADNKCSSSVEVHGRQRLKSGDLSYTIANWDFWREHNLFHTPPAEWLIRLVEDNRPGWWTTTD